MAHVDTAKLTPAMIDEVMNRFSYSSEDPTAYVLEDVMRSSILLQEVSRHMPPICMRQAAFNWLRIGVMLGFEIAEQLAATDLAFTKKD